MALKNADQIRDHIEALSAPTRSDVLRAKSRITEVLQMSASAATSDLVHVLADKPNLRDKVRLSDGDSWEQEIHADLPLVANRRLEAAAWEALAELEADGAIQRVFPATNQTFDDRRHAREISLSIEDSRGGEGVRFDRHLPDVGGAYRLKPDRLPGTVGPDLDALLREPEGMGLDRRTSRTMREALDAFRRGLYLASAVLLGVASEGMWYTAAATYDSEKLRQAVAYTKTDEVIRLVSQRFKEQNLNCAEIDYVVAKAHFLRSLRNYGAHPRPEEDEALEAYFTEPSVATELLEFPHYVQRFSDLFVRSSGKAP